MTTSNQSTADVDFAYAAAHAAVLAKLQAMQTLIENMPAPGSECAIDWAYVGSLKLIDGQLQSIIEFAS
jgi:hypothetical protein